MDNTADEEVLGAVHSREICVHGECRRHPHRRKRPRETVLRLKRELREEDFDALAHQ